MPIEFNRQLTADWLDKAWKSVKEQKNRVDARSKERGYPIT